MTAMREDISWLEPYPDTLLPATSSPEETLRLHESVRLAFVRAMQVLPARQRAALILHDVLDFEVSDVATMLETTVPAIHSALQRARVARAGAERRGRRDERGGARAHRGAEGPDGRTLRPCVGDGRLRGARLDADGGRRPHDAAVGLLARRPRRRRRDDAEPRDLGWRASPRTVPHRALRHERPAGGPGLRPLRRRALRPRVHDRPHSRTGRPHLRHGHVRPAQALHGVGPSGRPRSRDGAFGLRGASRPIRMAPSRPRVRASARSAGHSTPWCRSRSLVRRPPGTTRRLCP